MNRTETVIEVKNLYKTFVTGFLPYAGVSRALSAVWPKGTRFISKRVEAVKDFSFSVKKGEIFGLLGPNGAGKTTTLKILMGLIFKDKGEIEIFGLPPGSLRVKKKIGFLPENPYFYDYLKAEEFLSLVASLTGIPRRERKERIHRILEKVGLLGAIDRPLRKFSKGMLQRIGLAQALISNPELVVLDEPLSGLDPVGRKEIRDIVWGLKKEGKTVLFSSHILSDVELLCDRVAIMAEGGLRQMGTLDELLKGESGITEVVLDGEKALLDEFLREWKGEGELLGEKARFVTKTGKEKDLLLRKALEKDLSVETLVPRRSSLEELFMLQAGSSENVDKGISGGRDHAVNNNDDKSGQTGSSGQ